MAIEIIILIGATVLIARRVNIAIGEVKGIYEHIFITMLSTSPLLIENITTINAMTKSIVIGITETLTSYILDTVEPTAPYINA
jgi:hypothetical protein